MPTDATGTPTALGIPTYNVDNDAPSGLGFNATMAVIDSLLQLRALLSGAAFTGSVTVPTPAAGDNSTKAATTAYIESRLGVVVGTNNANVSTNGATFGVGADLLAADLSFTALAGASYEVVVNGGAATNSGGGFGTVDLKLDGAQGAALGLIQGASTGTFYGRTVISPAAGAHTLNARMFSNNTGNTVVMGGATVPITVTIRRIS